MRLRKLALALALVPMGLTLGVMPTSASAPQTYVVGVDGTGPSNHNFEFVDFFPRRGVTVHQGDVIDFKWGVTPDGLHTATLLPGDQSPPDFVVPDESEGLQINPAVLAPSDFTCGGIGNPCDYNGSKIVSSGAQPTVPGIDFYAKIDTGPGLIQLICEIHPGMAATIKVVGNKTPTPSPARVAAEGKEQLRADIREARDAIANLDRSLVKENSNGTRTVTIIAGTATQHVEIAEMLPSKARIRAGDTVTWVTKTLKDPHTVTFPLGDGSNAVDPLLPACEGSPSDTSPPCASPPLQELHFVPQPQGPTVISSPSTVATSGVISTFGPFPDRYSFTFPNPGTFAYQCRIHDHMTGTLIVKSAGATD